LINASSFIGIIYRYTHTKQNKKQNKSSLQTIYLELVGLPYLTKMPPASGIGNFNVKPLHEL